MDLKSQILETVKLHVETARAAYKSRDREVAVLKGTITMLEHTLAELRIENRVLKEQLHRVGGMAHTDCLGVR